MNKQQKQVEEWLVKSGQTRHPLLMPLSQQEAIRIQAQFGIEALEKAIHLREEAIRLERRDPLRNGWEPPFWWVCDALRGQRFASPAWKVKFSDVDWADWSEEVRDCYGLDEYWKQFLISGSNRAGKSEYAGKRTVLTLVELANSVVWCFAKNETNSIDLQQPIIRRYMPPEWNALLKQRGGNMSWIEKNGFTGMKFVTPKNSRCSFRTYKQDLDAVEGGEVDFIWCDELLPLDLAETLKARVSTRKGSVLVTFTPVDGYTPTVQYFQDGADVLLDVPAFLLPKDGKEPLLYKAFGFESQQAMDRARLFGCWCQPGEIGDFLVA